MEADPVPSITNDELTADLDLNGKDITGTGNVNMIGNLGVGTAAPGYDAEFKSDTAAGVTDNIIAVTRENGTEIFKIAKSSGDNEALMALNLGDGTRKIQLWTNGDSYFLQSLVIGATSTTAKFQVVGEAILGGQTAKFITDGIANTYWSGIGSGLPYGTLYMHEAAQTVNLVQNNYVKVTGWTTGLLNTVTINSDAFRVSKVGVYKVDWQISCDPANANQDIECDIFVNSVEQSDGSARRNFGTANDVGSFGGTALLDITSTSHDIDLRMKNITSSNDADIYHANFNILHVGGT